ncbi:hypothetical protein OHB26_35550 [Nocardia sp. NBC_01503]|uniref:hypothetical protein n=1 Tax=Nocardia sp. NBC_01503 TaxID=2975997 RepID=UPI002E7BB755|nr:hypothetical protein [Nocardia sp. NBC_01503]WTL32149.1 hypothetical protein OHB26_35550 [Nocardia sp. NBC_01503]
MSEQMATAEAESAQVDDAALRAVAEGSGQVKVSSRSGRGFDRRIRQLRSGGTVSVRLSTVMALGLAAVLLLATLVLGWVAYERGSDRDAARAEVAALGAAANDRHHAERVATEYSVGAADMNFKDLAAWSQRLTANTSPQLANKLKQAAASMEQIIVPLQWISAPTPIAATVRSEQGGSYVVTCFVSVMTKNTQAPDGVQSTATYTVTIDKNAGWKITDVGGIDSAMSGK